MTRVDSSSGRGDPVNTGSAPCWSVLVLIAEEVEVELEVRVGDEDEVVDDVDDVVGEDPGTPGASTGKGLGTARVVVVGTAGESTGGSAGGASMTGAVVWAGG